MPLFKYLGILGGFFLGILCKYHLCGLVVYCIGFSFCFHCWSKTMLLMKLSMLFSPIRRCFVFLASSTYLSSWKRMSSIYICRSLVNILCFARAKLHLNIDVYLLVLKMKSAQRRCKHCALAVVILSQKLSPRRRPFPGGAGWPKFNQLEMVTTFTYKPSLVRISARNFELSW